jgi:hypothetical protein
MPSRGDASKTPLIPRPAIARAFPQFPMGAVRLASSLVLATALSGCVAAIIITAPISLAGNVLEAGGQVVLYVGGQRVRVTGDIFDRSGQDVLISVIYQRGRNETRTEEKIIKARNLERAAQNMSRRGKGGNVAVEPVA